MKLLSCILLIGFQTALFTVQATAGSYVAGSEQPKHVVIFYSIVGMGHLTAAKAVSSELLRTHPETKITLKSIDDFGSKWLTDLKLSIYSSVVKNYPEVYDWFYHQAMANMRKGGLEAAFEHAPISQVLQYIQTIAPDVLLTTHQGTGVLLARLRKSNQLPPEKFQLGLIWTDFFVESYPKFVSSQLDHTWVPHPILKAEFISQGVSEVAVSTTGMPLTQEVTDFLQEGAHSYSPLEAPQEDEETRRDTFMASHGLDSKVPTITIASGSEGVGDYPALVKNLIDSFAHQNHQSLQIVAVCAKNKNHYKHLSTLAAALQRTPLQNGAQVKLKVLGFIPQADLLHYIKYSDLYITKSGGLSPPEGFAMNRPMILLDVYGGHERVNATFFKKIGVALINKDPSEIGHQAMWLLSDKGAAVKRRLRMSRAQREFTALQDLSGISDFVFETAVPSQMPFENDINRKSGQFRVDFSGDIL